ncbi:hypothetical protein NKJ92_30455, partial [Mesorhizobium sp. M0026]|uniref:hypothetical protein n=2 Tax=unclassified Mesorhizobium TaxID=325217 RepID=UPI003335D34D
GFKNLLHDTLQCLAKAVLIRQQQRFQLASAQSNVSIGHGTSPSTGIGDRNVTTVPWPLAPQSKRRSLSKTFCRTFSTLSEDNLAVGWWDGSLCTGD